LDLRYLNAIEGYNYKLKLDQGCQIFLGTTLKKGKNIPNNHKIYQMAIKYAK
jgi:hypothetical protein